MDRAFFIHVQDRTMKEQPLPNWYNRLDDVDGYPIGKVLLIADGSVFFTVNVKPSTTDQDFLVFEHIDALTFRITLFPNHQELIIVTKFHIVMRFPQNKNLWLLTEFMDCYFNVDNLHYDFTILFGTSHTWTVKIRRLWDMFYLIVDFSQVAHDLCLIPGDLIVFELGDGYDFRIQFFRPNGLQSIIPDIALCVDDVVKSEEDAQLSNDYVHLDNTHVTIQVDHMDIYQVQDKYDEQNDVLNVLPNVPLVEPEVVIEQPLMADLPIPPIVAQTDLYELTWNLIDRFRFPQPFALNVDLSILNQMTIETQGGFSSNLEMRTEKNHGKIRYALRGWGNFMVEGGLQNGGQYVLRYYRNINKLLIVNVNG